jgi:hypothetical protein
MAHAQQDPVDSVRGGDGFWAILICHRSSVLRLHIKLFYDLNDSTSSLKRQLMRDVALCIWPIFLLILNSVFTQIFDILKGDCTLLPFTTKLLY